MKRLLLLGSFVLLPAMLLVLSLFLPRSTLASSAWQGQTTDWSNVRSGPSTTYSIESVDAPNTPVTV